MESYLKLLLLTISILYFGKINSFKFAVVSDIHVTPFYDPYASPNYPYFCSGSNSSDPNSTAEYAPYGRIGCDSPIKLLESFLQKINQSEASTLDILFLTGDFVGHGLSLEDS